ncbi:transmembrane protein 229B-like [Asterias amurensis]|uniref:transmembrane protein 229B-like n=1 Tax=Asterias amurensis TaxID=7602 RepID=UPI003AB38750
MRQTNKSKKKLETGCEEVIHQRFKAPSARKDVNDNNISNGTTSLVSNGGLKTRIGDVDESSYQPLPVIARLFFYGMHGFLDEIVFTALYDILVHGKPNYQLVGYSSIYSFFIYGSGSYIIERIYVNLRHRVQLGVRIAIYVCVAFLWELSAGLILRQFDACSWDYSDRSLNFLGLITLTYAPCWALCGLWQDCLSRYLLNLRVVPTSMKLT